MSNGGLIARIDEEIKSMEQTYEAMNGMDSFFSSIEPVNSMLSVLRDCRALVMQDAGKSGVLHVDGMGEHWLEIEFENVPKLPEGSYPVFIHPPKMAAPTSDAIANFLFANQGLSESATADAILNLFQTTPQNQGE